MAGGGVKQRRRTIRSNGANGAKAGAGDGKNSAPSSAPSWSSSPSKRAKRFKPDIQASSSPTARALAAPTAAPKRIRWMCTLTALLLYLRSTWTCHFPYDDGVAVRTNSDVLNQSNADSGSGVGVMSPWVDVLRHDFWGTPLTSPLTHKSYRPIVVCSFRIDALITGFVERFVERFVLGERWVEQLYEDAADVEHKGAWMFHFTNCVLYAAVCYLVVEVVLWPAASGSVASVAAAAEANSYENDDERRYYRAMKQSALLAGLWFASHPVHTECVAQIVGRAEMLSASLCLAGTRFFGLASSSEGGGGEVRGVMRRLSSCLLMISCLFLACLCKETAVVIPIVLVGTDIAAALLAPRNAAAAARDRNRSGATEDGGAGTAARPTFPILASLSAISVTVGYLLFRSWLFSGNQDLSEDNLSIVDNFVVHLSGWTKFRTALYIQAKYMQLLLWPVELSSDYSLGVLEPVANWLEPSMIMVYAAILGLIAVVITALRTIVKTRNSTLVHAIGWTLAPLVPASHIVTIGTPMAERLLFTPSIGVAIMICHFLPMVLLATTTTTTKKTVNKHSLSRRQSATTLQRTVGTVALTSLCLAIARFAIMTYQRVPEWADSSTVFNADVKKFPRSIKLNNALARGFWGDKPEEASKSYEHARMSQEVVDSYDDGNLLTHPPYVIGLSMMAFQKTRTTVWPDGANLVEALDLVDDIFARNEKRRISTDELSSAYSASGQALLKLGVSKRDRSALGEAETAFKQSERNDDAKRAPYLVYCSYGLTLVLLGKKEEAYEKYQICLSRKPPQEIGYVDIVNYCNLMGELSGVLTKNSSAAAEWGDRALAAFDMILTHPDIKDREKDITNWNRMKSWVLSNR